MVRAQPKKVAGLADIVNVGPQATRERVGVKNFDPIPERERRIVSK